jgi:post-segregation antitoxin (ccd killing protein)
MPKQKLTLSIDKDIITKAKNKGINLSSFLEIRLNDYLNYNSRRAYESDIRFERP